MGHRISRTDLPMHPIRKTPGGLDFGHPLKHEWPLILVVPWSWVANGQLFEALRSPLEPRLAQHTLGCCSRNVICRTYLNEEGGNFSSSFRWRECSVVLLSSYFQRRWRQYLITQQTKLFALFNDPTCELGPWGEFTYEEMELPDEKFVEDTWFPCSIPFLMSDIDLESLQDTQTLETRAGASDGANEISYNFGGPSTLSEEDVESIGKNHTANRSDVGDSAPDPENDAVEISLAAAPAIAVSDSINDVQWEFPSCVVKQAGDSNQGREISSPTKSACLTNTYGASGIVRERSSGKKGVKTMTTTNT
ncbi:hypothetical protein BU23DRAFT_575599 [Bimuria novae-zelandiae CBS 107.79]|uniref:Uncharacterized protein n=1 Tax=Bimuria novae-zelandiae CBS 107.79 TaxID=1447943 RepID=A0A6A5UIT5_9PLEO|nr:hypothetical protein BU23DRAFT_575599 [Bimuria novae-zelandiae CBS 107.79]